ncbi:MAG: hypothetical protein LBM75_06660 [Myxococcales bacterium]|jgi:hypothetical protein|nr:hypothetical protein [Myxococcales bacterium]
MNSEEARSTLNGYFIALNIHDEFTRELIWGDDWLIQETPFWVNDATEILKYELKRLYFVTDEDVELLFDVTAAKHEEAQKEILLEIASIYKSGIDCGRRVCEAFERAEFLNRALAIVKECSETVQKEAGAQGKRLNGLIPLARSLGIDAPASLTPSQSVESFFEAHKLPISPGELVEIFDRSPEVEHAMELELAIRAWASVKRNKSEKRKPLKPLMEWLESNAESISGKKLTTEAIQRVARVANYNPSPGANKTSDD